MSKPFFHLVKRQLHSFSVCHSVKKQTSSYSICNSVKRQSISKSVKWPVNELATQLVCQIIIHSDNGQTDSHSFSQPPWALAWLTHCYLVSQIISYLVFLRVNQLVIQSASQEVGRSDDSVLFSRAFIQSVSFLKLQIKPQ